MTGGTWVRDMAKAPVATLGGWDEDQKPQAPDIQPPPTSPDNTAAAGERDDEIRKRLAALQAGGRQSTVVAGGTQGTTPVARKVLYGA